MKSAYQLSNDDIIRAWKDEDFSKNPEAHFPENPAGVISLDAYRTGRLIKGNEILAASTQCASTYCASTECASTQCASTQCASTQCASTECASTQCASTECATVWPSC